MTPRALVALRAVLALALLPLAAGLVVPTYQDAVMTHLPAKVATAAQVRAGEFPFLNPAQSFGQPLAGNPNFGTFFPDTLLFLALPWPVAFGLRFALAAALAFAGARRWARAEGVPRPAAEAAGYAFALSGVYLSAWRFYNTGLALALAPFVLAAVAKACRRAADGRPLRRVTAELALWSGLEVLAGEPVVALLTAVAVVVRFASHAAGDDGARVPGRALGAIAAGAVLAALFAAPQIAATLQSYPGSTRDVAPFSFAMATGTSVHPARFLEQVAPFPHGRPDLTGPFGFHGHRLHDNHSPYLWTLHLGWVVLLLLAQTRPAARARRARLVAGGRHRGRPVLRLSPARGAPALRGAVPRRARAAAGEVVVLRRAVPRRAGGPRSRAAGRWPPVDERPCRAGRRARGGGAGGDPVRRRAHAMGDGVAGRLRPRRDRRLARVGPARRDWPPRWRCRWPARTCRCRWRSSTARRRRRRRGWRRAASTSGSTWTRIRKAAVRRAAPARSSAAPRASCGRWRAAPSGSPTPSTAIPTAATSTATARRARQWTIARGRSARTRCARPACFTWWRGRRCPRPRARSGARAGPSCTCWTAPRPRCAPRARPRRSPTRIRAWPRLAATVTTAAPDVVVWSRTFFPAWRATVDGAPVTPVVAEGHLVGVPVPAGTHRVQVWWPAGPIVAGAVLALIGAAVAATMAFGGRE